MGWAGVIDTFTPLGATIRGKKASIMHKLKSFRCTKKFNCLYFVYLQYTVSLTRAVSGELVAEFEASHL